MRKAIRALKMVLKRLEDPFVLKDVGSRQYSDNCSIYSASLLIFPLGIY